MLSRRTTSLTCLLSILSVLTVSYFILYANHFTYHGLSFLNIIRMKSKGSSLKRAFLVDTTNCKIPDIDPFDPAAMKFVTLGEELICSQKKGITYIEGSFLKFNRTKIDTFFGSNFKYCQYKSIRRGPRNSDSVFIYGDLSRKFDSDILLPPDGEFIRVDCYNSTDGKIATNYHAAIILKESVEKRSDDLFKEHVKKHAPKETYNVQMVGVDSVSRLNFIRQMQQTRKFLHEELQAFELTGYNKVADNTFVNIVPILTGMFVEEMGWNETMANQPFDKYPFLWKNFSNAGYRTLYAEDAPYMAIFNYLKEGFHEPPADFYNRPLSLAMERDADVWSKSHYCMGDRLETAMLLDYVTDFSRTFKNKPHFGFTFISRLTHEHMETAGFADGAYVTFLRRFNDEGYLNNTVLIFYSDHGNRYSKFRTTYIGKVEERMPFFYFVFPPSFHEKYPELVKNLRTNARRLTTPFDIYETLKDILYFDGVKRGANRSSRGISLFREVPEKRTCDQAGILPHWCMCMEQKPLDTSSKLAIDIGNALVDHINAILKPVSNLCALLTLSSVSDVIQMQSNEKVLQFQQSLNDVINRTVSYGAKTSAPTVYRTTLSTMPGQALFEATLTYDPSQSTFVLGGDVSRINAYDNQSHCVNNSLLKKLCFCL